MSNVAFRLAERFPTLATDTAAGPNDVRSRLLVDHRIPADRADIPMTRTAAAPPHLPGFTPVRLIGVGGYADVFLYEQQMPKRHVAVKVLIAEKVAGSKQRAQFSAEANLMARVSTHPYIVSVFDAAIASDGRPYLVMEYYPELNFLERARRERFSVAETLRVGVQIASAVETAHRSGVLHRDIKPANILTSEYGRPGLTDFGIAAPDQQQGEEADGMSVPWSPPEAFGTARLDERADVYSLAATVYHLLAGRSPFEVPSGANNPLDLMNRIERQSLPPTGRPDVPASLERVLAIAMSREPSHRPKSAAEFARLLQEVEAELHLAVTQLELANDGRHARLLIDTDSDEATRIKGVTTIEAQVAPGAIDVVPMHPTGIAAPPQRPRQGMLAAPEIESTVVRAHEAAPAAEIHGPAVRRNPAVIVGSLIAAVVAAYVAATVVAVAVTSDGDDAQPTSTQTPNAPPVFAVDTGPGAVEDLTISPTGDGTFTVSWSAPTGAATTVQYQVVESSLDGVETSSNAPQSSTSFVADLPCVEVIAIDGGLASVPVDKCDSGGGA